MKFLTSLDAKADNTIALTGYRPLNMSDVIAPMSNSFLAAPPFLQSWSFVMPFSNIILFALLLDASLISSLPLQKRCVVSAFNSCDCLIPHFHSISRSFDGICIVRLKPDSPPMRAQSMPHL